MVVRDRKRQWVVSELIGALRDPEGNLADERAYIVIQRKDASRAIVPIDPDGGIAKTATYLEVMTSTPAK
jgi:hypothetical protein